MSVWWLIFACDTPEPAPPPALMIMVEHILAQTDADQDGQISQAEYAVAAFTDDPLRTYDLDQSGTITEDELMKMLQEIDPAEQQDARRQRWQGEAYP